MLIDNQYKRWEYCLVLNALLKTTLMKHISLQITKLKNLWLLKKTLLTRFLRRDPPVVHTGGPF